MTQLRSQPAPISKGACLKIIPIVLLFASFNSFSQEEIQYKLLLEIELNHDYFKDGYDRSLTVKPSPSTRDLFRKHDLRLMQRGKSFSIYAPTTFNLEEYLQDNPILWQFECETKDALFFSYTDMGSTPAILNFSNNNLDENTTHLTSKLIPVEIMGPKAATIDIHVDQLYPHDPDQHTRYKAKFNSRKTAIRYYIINSKPDPIAFELEGEQAHLFNGPVLTELPNGKKAYVFDSGNNLFHLRNYPSIDLSLKFNIELIQTTLTQNLPSPNPEYFIIEDQKYISVIYVHI